MVEGGGGVPPQAERGNVLTRGRDGDYEDGNPGGAVQCKKCEWGCTSPETSEPKVSLDA